MTDTTRDAQFALTTSQLAFRDTAARFAVDVLAPAYKSTETAGIIPMEIRRQMGDLGLIGVEFPEEFGGLGLDHVASGVVIEAT